MISGGLSAAWRFYGTIGGMEQLFSRRGKITLVIG